MFLILLVMNDTHALKDWCVFDWVFIIYWIK